jgi:hypothetical protein
LSVKVLLKKARASCRFEFLWVGARAWCERDINKGLSCASALWALLLVWVRLFLAYRLERASEPKAHAIECSAWTQALDSFDFVQQ